jgi:hypothetical protein
MRSHRPPCRLCAKNRGGGLEVHRWSHGWPNRTAAVNSPLCQNRPSGVGVSLRCDKLAPQVGHGEPRAGILCCCGDSALCTGCCHASVPPTGDAGQQEENYLVANTRQPCIPLTDKRRFSRFIRLLLPTPRVIWSILIALSLILAPVASAWAAAQMSRTMMAVDTDQAAASEVPDCEKMMQRPATKKNCACCDTHAKSPFPSADTCVAKCSVHIIGIVAPMSEIYLPMIRYIGPSEPEKPPDYRLRPPSPPPRA